MIALISAAVADDSLPTAAEHQRWNDISTLLKARSDVNVAQVDGMTALHWAVYHDHAETVEKLIDADANVNASNRYGVTPLSLACVNGNAVIVEQLLNAKADADVAINGGETPLMTAARTGRLRPVQQLMKHGAKVDAKDWKGQTALMWAASSGIADVVQALLDAGADRSATLKSGFNSLFFAIREGQTQAALTLLAAGDDVNSTMNPNRSGGKAPRKGTSPLILAVENGHFELAVELLKYGADPNDQRSGFTALHTITWVRKPDRGDNPEGDPSPIGSGNLSSLQFVEKLVQAGADVNVRLKEGHSGRGRLNQKGATPFLFAADTADVPLMKLLLKLGADPHIPNADGCPPLLAAAGIGSLAPGEEAGTEEEALEAVKLLLELGADIDTVDDNGETAMHGAAYKCLPEMVRYLAANGADIGVWNRPNKYKWTPLLISQGFRPGNFKPAPATTAAIESVMRSKGVEPPPAPDRPENNSNYAKPEKKSP
ncbi:MAG: ankyrin repeat domain-containing protein [Planctomycetaceae bacterium]